MALLCLLTNTPWPWPTPARAASARGGFPPRSATEGERSEGLHKRSAEDEGAPCARQERSSSGRLGFLAFSAAARKRLPFGALRGIPAEEGVGRRRSHRRLEQGGVSPPPFHEVFAIEDQLSLARDPEKVDIGLYV